MQGAKPSTGWQNHKKKAMLAMLEELPKWIKMTDPTANVKAAAAAADSTNITATEKSLSEAGSPPSLTKSMGQSFKRLTAQPVPPVSVAPLPSTWNMVRFLSAMEDSLKKAAEAAAAAATQSDKSPAKDVRRSIFDVLPNLLMPMQWKKAAGTTTHATTCMQTDAEVDCD